MILGAPDALGTMRKELWDSISRKAAFSKEWWHLVLVMGWAMGRRVMGHLMLVLSETAWMSSSISSSVGAAVADRPGSERSVRNQVLA